MEEEDELRLQLDRGFKAKQLLENEMLVDAFQYARDSYTKAWKAATTPELREKAWDLVHAVDKVEEHLTTVLNNGKLADYQIRELVAARELTNRRRPRAA